MSSARMAQIAINKSLLKEYTVDGQRAVYLNDGTEFQIQIFNSTQKVVGYKIYVNGDLMPKYLVLKPGERCWLERLLGEQKKLKFSTYEVDDCPEALKAIAKNGEIRVEAYYERERCFNSLKLFETTSSIPAVDNPWRYGTWTTCENQNANYCQTLSTNPTEVLDYTITATATNTSAGICDSYVIDTTIETGRIEKGGYSQQVFEEVGTEFNYSSFATEIIKILPESRKPATVEDTRRRYCPYCGKKVKDSFKFCPSCGKQLN